VKTLTRFQFRSRLFLVPFGDIQQRVVLAVAPPLRVVVYRRLMMRIAERIAKLKHAQALVTGDAVGQVASQTLENMSIIGRVASLPVLRPLVGMDKEEIIAEAQRLGTFSISIIPDQDCCTLFTPRHPATKAKPDDIERAEAELPVDDMVRQAVDAAAVEHFTFPI
jgi:tRNA uracil 4-sulfurtransferase